MSWPSAIHRLGGALNALQPLVLLATRLLVALPFWQAGLVKIRDWENTVFLFEEEYRVPVLSPALAALAGTAGELVFPVLLVIGLGTRLASIGLSVVNVVAVVAYAHVLLQAGFEAAVGQHRLWGYLLLVLIAFGPGAVSVDHWLSLKRVSSLPPGPA